MKRLTLRYKLWLMNRAKRENRRRSHGTKWTSALVASRSGSQWLRVLPQPMPSVLCLDTAYHATVGFVAELRARTIRGVSPSVRAEMARRRGRLKWLRNYRDFSCLTQITPGAALLVAAEYDRARQIAGVPLSVVDLERWDHDVYASLRALGFFELLDLPEAPMLALPDGFFIQRLASEAAANSKPAIDQIVDLFGKAGGDAGLRLDLCGAVVDALENVKDHAYPQDCFVGIRHVPNWWFTGAAHRDKRWLMLGLYDQGITIPVSLPRRFGGTEVKAAFARRFGLSFDVTDPKYDGQALDIAMRLSATSTGEPFRGKGLSKIREVVSRCKGGELRIVSRSGEYLFRSGRAAFRNHEVALPGTYIELTALF